MRYFFKGKIEQNGDVYQIRVPFNVWEICKKRDVIDANINLANKSIECKLLPVNNNGRYKINLSEQDIQNLDIEQEHEVLLRIRESLIKLEENSPYSSDNPVRKIDSMEVIIQPVDGLCGQTCIAMLAGVTIEEVMSVLNLREWQAKMGEMISALNYYGIEHSDTVVFTEGRQVTLPKCCIMMEKMGLYCHYLIYYDGKFYDPNLPVFEEYDLGKLEGYLEVKCE
jgi:hypothetical protein